MTTMSPVQALTWIVASLLLIPGGLYKGVNAWISARHKTDFLCRIIQTGPQKEALKTPYLAELLHLSADQPVPALVFDAKLAQKNVLTSPVVKQAVIKVIQPDTVYIDYTVRQPVASLYDFENIALDEEGVPFPIVPFFTPKKLPEIVLGVTSFVWNHPFTGAKIELAFNLLKLMQQHSLNVLCLDVTASTAPSLGKREVVVVLEEQGRSRYLRLTPKNYAQEINHYLELRKTLQPETHVIDLRLPHLAYLQDKPSSG